jgi:hypothetical protein
LKTAIYLVNLAAILATLTIIIFSLKPTEIVPSDLKLVPLLLWNISPFLGMAAITRWLGESKLRLGLLFGASLIAAVLEIWILVDALIINMHVLNFFLLIGLPNIGWIFVLTILAIVFVLRLVEKRHNLAKD